MEKHYVPVVVYIYEKGKKKPLAIEFDGRRHEIDRVMKWEPAACNSVGGVGIKYTRVVWGKIRELWEEKCQWIVVLGSLSCLISRGKQQ